MTETAFNQAFEKVQTAIKLLEAQDIEVFGYVPMLDFGTLDPEAVENMLENRHMVRSKSCERECEAIINCKSTPGERMRNYKKLIGDE